MSLPMFPQIDPPLTREESLNEIISSIASEELKIGRASCRERVSINV